MVEFYQPLAELKLVEMTIETATPIPLRGDEDLMREAISNLVDNAVELTPEGGLRTGRGSYGRGAALGSRDKHRCGV